jgi:hypothetical protein
MDLKKATLFFEKTIPLSSLIIVVTGMIIFFIGLFLIWVPVQLDFSPGIGIFAIGLALMSFGISQYNAYKLKITTAENNERMIRIEEKIDNLRKGT